jgi:RimJ/RimL family protein N-acetyltransferase
MSLEFVLERYPLKTHLKDGTAVTVRPLGKRDATALQKFFYAVPEPERLFIERPVTDKKFFTQTCAKIDPNQDFTLLMLHGAKIIGWINLHQRQGGWRRHIGRVTLLTHPNYRGRDVSLRLLEEIISAARYLGLWKLEAELTAERKIAIRSLEALGFRQLWLLPDYVIDMTRQPHDFLLMGLDLKTDEEYAAAG